MFTEDERINLIAMINTFDECFDDPQYIYSAKKKLENLSPKNTIHNIDYAKCKDELIQYFEDHKYILDPAIIEILKEHFA